MDWSLNGLDGVLKRTGKTQDWDLRQTGCHRSELFGEPRLKLKGTSQRNSTYLNLWLSKAEGFFTSSLCRQV